MSKGNDEVMDCARANKIIAEYMGYYFIGVEKKRIEDLPCLILTRMSDGERVYKYPYSESLDALVPVWEKLDKSDIGISINPFWRRGDFTHNVEVWKMNQELIHTERYGDTIQEAACIATAKAIRELE